LGARSLYSEILEDQYRLGIERAPASTELEITSDRVHKLINSGFSLYKNSDGTYYAKKNGKDFVVYNQYLCTERVINLSELTGKGYKVSNVNNEVYIQKNNKTALVHPSFRLLCFAH
jgi:hypothetical protein